MIVVAVVFLLSGCRSSLTAWARSSSAWPRSGRTTPPTVNPDSLLFRDYFEVLVANFLVGIAIILQPHIISKALYLRTEARREPLPRHCDPHVHALLRGAGDRPVRTPGA
jgi:sodium/pantothenate symporter